MPGHCDIGKGQKQHIGKRRLWVWFVAGFQMVFIAMSLTVTTYTWDPSGQWVVACKLWQYYVLEARRAMSPSRNILGPVTGSLPEAVAAAFGHVLWSAVGGVGMLGIGWVVGKTKDLQRRPS